MINNKNDLPIWMCWFQGLDDPSLPIVNLLSFYFWKKINPESKVHILTDKNIDSYVPEYYDILKKTKYKRRLPCKADLLRILLLAKYGGIWADASLIPVYNAKFIVDSIANKEGFFAYRFPKVIKLKEGIKTIGVWFLFADPTIKPYIITQWRDKFIESFVNLENYWYSEFGNTFTKLVSSEDKFSSSFLNIPIKHVGSAHRFGKKMMELSKPSLFKRFKNKVPKMTNDEFLEEFQRLNELQKVQGFELEIPLMFKRPYLPFAIHSISMMIHQHDNIELGYFLSQYFKNIKYLKSCERILLNYIETHRKDHTKVENMFKFFDTFFESIYV